jgi:hypothetical protein
MSFIPLTPGTPQYEANPVQRHLSSRGIPGRWYRLEGDLSQNFRVFPNLGNGQIEATLMISLAGALQGGPFRSVRFELVAAESGSDQCIVIAA